MLDSDVLAHFAALGVVLLLDPEMAAHPIEHLNDAGSQVGAAAHALLVLTPAPAEAGGAGWHDSQALAIPDNITLLALPPYSPELNPVERIWHYLRSHWLANSVFRSLADIMDACERAWNCFAADPGLIRSLCAVAWAPG